VIRFPCTNCGRKYVLPDALARLPLICKGCGQRLNVPGPGEGDEPEPGDEEPDEDVSLEVRAAGQPKEEPPIFLSADVKSVLDLKPDHPPGQPRPTAGGKPPPPTLAPPGQRALWLAADVAVGLVLAALGALLGEFTIRKSTAAILREAGSAPKFPPTDLILWLGCVAMPVMAYVLFAKRGRSVGGWLRRRAGG
jgi:hypothetical protein